MYQPIIINTHILIVVYKLRILRENMLCLGILVTEGIYIHIYIFKNFDEFFKSKKSSMYGIEDTRKCNLH